MADGAYERRARREAELKRFARLIAESRASRASAPGAAEAGDFNNKERKQDR